MTCTVCMLVTNPVTNDPRVRREAACLSRSGRKVVIIGVRADDGTKEDSLDDCAVVRVAHPRWILRKARLRCMAAWERIGGRKKDGVSPQARDEGATRSGESLRDPSSGLSHTHHEESPRTVVGRLWADLLNILNVVWLNIAIARVAVGQKAEVYHSHDLDTLFAGFVAKQVTHAKLVYDFHELFTEQYRRGAKTWVWKGFYSLLERLLIGHTELKLTVCDSIGAWVSDKYGTTRAVTVRNCPSVHDAVPRSTGLKREKVVLYHGAYIADRGIEQLIESAQYLSRAKVVLRGVGPLESDLKALVQKKGLEEKVTFAPSVAVAQLVEAASEADIGAAVYLPVCLNAQFCLPNKLFEYMMAGLAIVGSDLPELRAVILGGRQPIGTVCDPSDPKDLARAINAIAEDDALLERLKRHARAAATSIYNWEIEGRRLVDAYDALTAR